VEEGLNLGVVACHRMVVVGGVNGGHKETGGGGCGKSGTGLLGVQNGSRNNPRGDDAGVGVKKGGGAIFAEVRT